MVFPAVRVLVPWARHLLVVVVTLVVSLKVTVMVSGGTTTVSVKV